MNVTATTLSWEPVDSNGTEITVIGNVVRCETYVDEELATVELFDLDTLGERELPTEIGCGTITVDGSGAHDITVKLILDGSSATVTQSFQAYGAGVSIIPLIVVLMLAMFTQMVEFSLFFAVFVGACMVAGNVKDGFKDTLNIYLLEAIADVDHGYVYLFTLCLSGMVSVCLAFSQFCLPCVRHSNKPFRFLLSYRNNRLE
jgi:hypothetical protein